VIGEEDIIEDGQVMDRLSANNIEQIRRDEH